MAGDGVLHQKAWIQVPRTSCGSPAPQSPHRVEGMPLALPAVPAHTRWGPGEGEECGGGFITWSQRGKVGQRKGPERGGALRQLCHWWAWVLDPFSPMLPSPAGSGGGIPWGFRGSWWVLPLCQGRPSKVPE